MDANRMLVEAQMHLESMNEAFLDMAPAMAQIVGADGQEALTTVWAEVNARVWAAIHLVQSVRMGKPDEGLEQARREVGHYTADAPHAQDLH